MSKARSRSYDVFLSSSQADRQVAQVVKRAIEDRGLSVIASAEVPAGAAWEDMIRSALADARVFVAILSPLSLDSTWIGIELGASLAWGKSIYLLLDQGVSKSDLRGPFSQQPSFPLSKLANVIDQIEPAIKPIEAREAKVLADLYESVGVTSDRLAMRPAELRELTDKFSRAVGRKFSPESVLQEVIRLRKRGALPRLGQRAS